MKKIIKPIVVIIILAGITLFLFFSEVIVGSTLCFYWHLKNNSIVHGDNFKIKLPFMWWVFSDKNNTITLNRIPPIGENRFANIFIMNKILTKEELNSFKEERMINGELIRKKDIVNTSSIDDETAYNIEYVIYKSENNKGYIIWTWTIPSKKLVINIVNLNPQEKVYIIDEILKNVDFIQ